MGNWCLITQELDPSYRYEIGSMMVFHVVMVVGSSSSSNIVVIKREKTEETFRSSY